jgi:3-hydroxybutyryl-CoA dehydrogenase
VLPSLNAGPGPSPLLRDLVGAGRLGARSGTGFLSWPPGAREAAAQRLAAHVTQQLDRAVP